MGKSETQLGADRGRSEPAALELSLDGAATGDRSRSAGFTLIELLVVISIIGILAAVALPAFKGFGASNTLIGAERQMLDDLAQARLRAISERATVYVVFFPPLAPNAARQHYNQLTRDDERRYFLNLLKGQYTSYAFFARRTVGDQPGREFPRYLTEWQTLPEGIFFAPGEFNALSLLDWQRQIDPLARPFQYPDVSDVGVPFASSPRMRLPYVAFNSQGQLVSGRDEVISAGKGSILQPADLLSGTPDLVDPQPTNRVHVRINWLTGRARIERVEVR